MPLRILIFSDNRSFADYLCQLLKAAGHTTVRAPEGADAYRAIRSEKPHLAIVAADAANVARYAVEQRVQTEKGSRHVPLLVVSDSAELEAGLLNALDFIPKPLDAVRLFDAVAAVEKNPFPAAPPPLTDRQYVQFSSHILACTGLYFESRNRSALERGIRKRMTALLMESCNDYLAYLKKHGETRHELQRLVQHLTVGETYFFRYPSQYDALRERLLARAHLVGEPVRIWSAGCSTGEEAYSIAMTVMETLPDWRSRDIRIIATDINSLSLKKAREGVYNPWSIRSTERRHVERYFERVGESYAIKAEVKRLVTFTHMNLSAQCRGEFCGELQDLDVIFCRNVLIYFSAEVSAALLARFAAALKPSGQLFLGHAETMFQRPAELEIRRQQNTFYYVKSAEETVRSEQMVTGGAESFSGFEGGANGAGCVLLENEAAGGKALSVPPFVKGGTGGISLVPAAAESTAPMPQHAVPSSAETAAPAGDLKAARALFDSENIDGALEVVDALLAGTPDDEAALILRGFILASKGRIAEALETCTRVIAINDLLPDAYFLKGMLLDASDFLAEAADEYRKAILLDHDFIMPRYYMGRLHLRLGRVSEAAREIRNSIKLLAKRGEEETIPYSGGLTPSVCIAQLQNALAQVA